MTLQRSLSRKSSKNFQVYRKNLCKNLEGIAELRIFALCLRANCFCPQAPLDEVARAGHEKGKPSRNSFMKPVPKAGR